MIWLFRFNKWKTGRKFTKASKLAKIADYRGRESNSNETHKVTSIIYISYNLLLEGFITIVIVEITHVEVLSVLCPVSVLSHSVESCGTCLTRTGVVFHKNINISGFKCWKPPISWNDWSGKHNKCMHSNILTHTEHLKGIICRILQF